MNEVIESALEKMKRLKAELEAATAEAADQLKAEKIGMMDEIVAAMEENKITLGDLSHYIRVSASKYSDADGNTWSGKGKKPSWVEKAVAGGKTLEQLLTKQPVQQQAAA